MTIKFVCSCGKRLRARDEMAARRSMCPRCGAPVGVPSGRPAVRGATAGPMTPAERLRARRHVPPPQPSDAREAGTAPAQLLDPDPADSKPARNRPAAPRGRRGDRELERHWHQCLLYPVRAWPLVLGLGAALTVLTGATALVLPEVLVELRGGPAEHWLVCVPLLLAFLLLPGYACAFLDCTLTSAAAGEARNVRWPGTNVGLVVKSALTWLICFLAGPVVPAVAGFFYWLDCGDPDALDWVILAELGAVAVGYWLLLLLAVSRGDRLLDANPARVEELVNRLGHRLVLAVFAASLVALAHGYWLLAALLELHRDLSGLALLAGCWVSVLFLATFLFRLLGVWCHRAGGEGPCGSPADGCRRGKVGQVAPR
jgi:hypothetical protein